MKVWNSFQSAAGLGLFLRLSGTGAAQHGAGFGWMYCWCLEEAASEEKEDGCTLPAAALLAAGSAHHGAR